MNKLFTMILTMILMLTCICAAAEKTEFAAGEYDPYNVDNPQSRKKHANIVPIQDGDYWYIILNDGTAEIVDSIRNPPTSISTHADGSMTVVQISEERLIPEQLGGIRVTSIGNGAFYRNVALANITIPNGITTIGYSAFDSCRNMTSITIPDSITSIGKRAFYECGSLTSIIIPEGVTAIQDMTFFGCDALTSVTIPEGVTTIGKMAFYECHSLTNITIPKGVTTIGEKAFAHCHSLTSITIPDSVTSIEPDAFHDCYSPLFIVMPNSFAEQYAIWNDFPYTHATEN